MCRVAARRCPGHHCRHQWSRDAGLNVGVRTRDHWSSGAAQHCSTAAQILQAANFLQNWTKKLMIMMLTLGYFHSLIDD